MGILLNGSMSSILESYPSKMFWMSCLCPMYSTYISIPLYTISWSKPFSKDDRYLSYIYMFLFLLHPEWDGGDEVGGNVPVCLFTNLRFKIYVRVFFHPGGRPGDQTLELFFISLLTIYLFFYNLNPSSWFISYTQCKPYRIVSVKLKEQTKRLEKSSKVWSSRISNKCLRPRFMEIPGSLN